MRVTRRGLRWTVAVVAVCLEVAAFVAWRRGGLNRPDRTYGPTTVSVRDRAGAAESGPTPLQANPMEALP